MKVVRCCVILTLLGASLAACGTTSAASSSNCGSNTVSVSVGAKPAAVCIQAGAVLDMDGGGGDYPGYWPGPLAVSNKKALHLIHSDWTGPTLTDSEGISSPGSPPGTGASTITAGTVTARFRALSAGVAKVSAKYVATPNTCSPVACTAKGHPLILTVTVVPRSGGSSNAISSSNQRSVKSLLLTASELPAYGTTQPTGWMDTEGGGITPPPMCPSHPLSELHAQGYASVTFNPQIDSGPELIEELVRSNAAAAEFATMRSILSRCKTFTVSIPDTPRSPQPATTLSGTLTPLPFPTYGDLSIAMVQTLNLPKVPAGEVPISVPDSLQTGSVLIREGDYLIALAYFPSSATFSASQLIPFVKPALSKLPD